MLGAGFWALGSWDWALDAGAEDFVRFMGSGIVDTSRDRLMGSSSFNCVTPLSLCCLRKWNRESLRNGPALCHRISEWGKLVVDRTGCWGLGSGFKVLGSRYSGVGSGNPLLNIGNVAVGQYPEPSTQCQ